MSAYDLLRFVLKWKWILLFGPLLAGGVAAYQTFQSPPRYTAEAKVLIERNRTPIQVGTQEVPALGMLEVMNTEVEIVRSRAVIAGAVDALGLGSEPDPEPAPPTVSLEAKLNALLKQWGLVQTVSGREGWIREFSARVRAVPVPDSNVFTISMSGTNPKVLEQVVNAVTESYLRHRLGVYQAQGRSHDFEVQTGRAWQRLEELRGALEAYKAKYNLAGIAELRSTLSMRNQHLAEQLSVLRQEQSSLQRRYLGRHPAVLEVQEKIATVQHSLSQVEREMRQVESHADRIRSIESEISSQENAYNMAKIRLDEQIARESTSPAAANALVVEYASEPVVFAAARLSVIFFGTFAGLALAIVLALLREYFDGRVEEPAEAEEILGLPVVGAVGRFRVSPNGFRDGDPASG